MKSIILPSSTRNCWLKAFICNHTKYNRFQANWLSYKMPCLIWFPRTLPAPPESRLNWGLEPRQFLLPGLSFHLTKLDKYTSEGRKIKLIRAPVFLLSRGGRGRNWEEESGRKEGTSLVPHRACGGAKVHHRTRTVLLETLPGQEPFNQEHQGCFCLSLEPQTLFIPHTVVSAHGS